MLSNEELMKKAQQARTQALANQSQNKETATQKAIRVQTERDLGLINDNLLDALSYGAKTGVNQLEHSVKSSKLGLGQTLTSAVGAKNTANELAEKLQQNAQEQAQRQAEIDSQYDTNFGMLAKGTSDLTSGIINMLPTIGAAALTPQGKVAAASKIAKVGAKALRSLPTAGTIGVTAGGAGVNQALNEGATINEAKKYGLGTAAKEIATELPFAGIAKVPGVVNLGNKLASKSKVASGMINAATEGAEEAASEYLDPFIQRATYKPNAENASMDDMLYAALLGSATAGVINGGMSGASKVANKALGGKIGQNKAANQVNNVQNAQNSSNQAQNGATINLSNQQQNVSQNQIYEVEKIRNQLISEQESILKEKRQLEERKQQLERGEQEKLNKEIQNLENNIALLKGNRSAAFDNALYNAMDKYTTPQQKTDTEQNIEMSERTFENVTDKKVKAYQSTHPEVKKYYREQAEIMLNDLNNMIDGGREYGINPETRNVSVVRSQSRLASSQIERLMNAGMTKAQIKDGLERIIRDNGAENTANAKKVEIAVDDSLTNGYQSMQGQVPKNFDFVYNNADANTMQAAYNRLNTEESFANSSNPNMLINELEYLNGRIDKKRALETEQSQLRDAYSTLLPDMSVYESMTAEELRNEMDKLESASKYAPDDIAQEMVDRYEYLETLENGRIDEFIENDELDGQIAELEKQLRSKKLTFDPKTLEEIRNIEKKLRELEAKQGGISIFNKQFEPTNNQAVAENATTTMEEPAAVVYEDYDLSKLPEDVLDFYDEAWNVAGKSHIDIRIVQNLPNNANGIYNPSDNTILLDGDKMTDIETIGKVISHEGYHALKDTDQHKYIIDLALQNRKLMNPNATMDSMITEKYEQYRAAGVNLVDENGNIDVNAVKDEIGASFIEEIMQNPDVAERVWDANQTLMGKLIHWIEDAIRKLKSIFKDNPQSEIYQKALDAYNQGLMNLQFAQQNTTQGAERYSVGSDVSIEQFAKQVDAVLDDNSSFEESHLVLGKTPDVLLNVGMPDLPIYMTAKHVYTIANSSGKYAGKNVNYHGLGADLVKQLPEAIANPLLIAESNTRSDSVVLLTKLVDKQNRPVIAAVKFDGKAFDKGIEVEANILSSAYGRNNAQTFFDDLFANDKVLYVNKKESSLLNNIPGVQFPDNIATMNFNNNISNFRKKVNENKTKKDSSSHLASTLKGSAMVDGMKPSEERTAFANTSISENRQNVNGNVRYSLPNEKYLDKSDENLRTFMEGSRVVNDDGTPKIVYSGHGNTNLFGSSFDPKKATSGGFYFTESPDIASSYANDKLGMKEVYENGNEYRFKDEKGKYSKRINDIYLTEKQMERLNEFTENEGVESFDDYVNENWRYDREVSALRNNGGGRNLLNLYKFYEMLGNTANGFDYKTGKRINTTFEDMLDAIGLDWDSYTKPSGGVFPVYLNIKNPIDTSQPFPDDLMIELEYAARKERQKDNVDDLRWTKDYPLKNWIEDIKNDDGTSGWATQIPTKARKIMLEMGYDGIKDVGGKNGGVEHAVWIALEPNQIKSATGNRGTFDAAKKDIRYSLDDLVDEYGAIPKGENPYGNNRDIDVPQQTSDFDKVSRFTRTAMEAEQIDDTTVGMIKDALISDMQTGRFIYEPSGNQEQVNKANRLIEHTGWRNQVNNFQTKYRSGQMMTADDIVLGERLIQEAENAGDYELAVDLVADVASIGTELGKAVQALSVLKRLSPEGKVKALKRVEERVNAGLIKEGKDTVAIPQELYTEMLQAESEQMQSDIWDRCVQSMADQVDATLMDKINAWRYLAMLSNPRTHIRNVVGNATMRGVSSIKGTVQAHLENRLLTAGEERYAALKRNVPQEYFKFAEYAWENEGKHRAKAGGGRYKDAISQIEQNKRIFNHELLEKARKANEYAMEDIEDMTFKKKAFIDALAEYMYANNLSPSELQNSASNANYEKGMEHALKEAYKATFQEASVLASFLAKIENSSTVGKIVVGALTPFKKTPINILKRGVEYSPVGLLQGLYDVRYGVQKGKISGAEAIDKLAAGLTGTAIMTIGYFMASVGMLTAGNGDDDDRKSWYDQQMGGSQNYALVLPNGDTLTIDWLAPSVMPLMAGAELYKQMADENPDNENSTAVTRMLEAISKVANPVLEMSMLQGLTSALQSYNSGTTGVLSDIMISSLQSYGGQFIPAPVGALARTVDGTVRSSYASKNSPITQPGEKFLRQQVNKIPVVSMANEASIDLWGNERKRAGGNIVGRAFNNFINPATYSSNKKTELDYTLDELYKATGDSSVFPKSASSTINETKQNPKISMTPREYAQYSTTQGKNSYSYVNEFVNSSDYEKLPDEDKAEVISKLYSLAVYQAKKEILLGRGYSYTNDTYEKALKYGQGAVKYYIKKQKNKK